MQRWIKSRRNQKSRDWVEEMEWRQRAGRSGRHWWLKGNVRRLIIQRQHEVLIESALTSAVVVGGVATLISPVSGGAGRPCRALCKSNLKSCAPRRSTKDAETIMISGDESRCDAVRRPEDRRAGRLNAPPPAPAASRETSGIRSEFWSRLGQRVTSFPARVVARAVGFPNLGYTGGSQNKKVGLLNAFRTLAPHSKDRGKP